MKGKKMIKLYTIGCPNCKVLEKKLNDSKIEYETITDENEMIKLGIQTAPMLEINGKMLDFVNAIKWIKENN